MGILKDHFSKPVIAEEMDSYYATDSFLSHRLDLMLRILHSHYRPGCSILEVGCGTGLLLSKLFSYDLAYTGIDLSEEMIKRCRKIVDHSSNKKISAELQAKDLLDTDWLNHFDYVIANGVIMYCEDQVSFLQKVSRSLKTEGVAFVSHRNALFNLFSLNEGFLSFFSEQLLDHLSHAERERIVGEIGKTFPSLKAEVKKSSSNDVFRSAENPLTIAELYKESGLQLVDIAFCSSHAFPPRYEEKGCSYEDPKFFEQFEHSWKGNFLSSQFIVTAVKV